MMSIPPIASPHHTATYCSPIHSPRASCSPSPQRRSFGTSSGSHLALSAASNHSFNVSSSSETPVSRKVHSRRGESQAMASKVTLSPSTQRRHRVVRGASPVFPSPNPAGSLAPPSDHSNNLFARDLAKAAAERQTPVIPRARKTSASSLRTPYSVEGRHSSALRSPKWTRRRRQTTEPSSGDEEDNAAYMTANGAAQLDQPSLQSPTSEEGDLNWQPSTTSAPSSTFAAHSTQSLLPQKRSSQATMLTSTPSAAASSSSTHLGAMRKPRSLMPSSASHQHSHAFGTGPALEDSFAQVSMTPPANFGSHVYRESPFASLPADHHAQQPATDVRKHTGRLPRSYAFGPFSPLQPGPHQAETRNHAQTNSRGTSLEHQQANGIRRTTRLDGLTASHQRKLALLDNEEDSSGTSADERPFGRLGGGAASPSLRAAEKDRLRQEMRGGSKHARARTTDSPQTEDSQLPSIVASRRGRAPTFLMTKREEDEMAISMDLDSDAEMGAPPSPTPAGDGSFSAGASGNLSSSSADGNLLQPGRLLQRGVNRRTSLAAPLPSDASSRASLLNLSNISAPATTDSSPMSAVQLFPRHNTSPSFDASHSRHKKTMSTSSSSSSGHGPPSAGSVAMKATKSASSSSPYKAKRRLASVGRNGVRTRAVSSVEAQIAMDGVESAPAGMEFGDVSHDFTFGGPKVDRLPPRMTRPAKQKGGLFGVSGSEFDLSSPAKSASVMQDDSGFAASSSPANDNTPFRPGDRLLSNRLGFEDTPEKGLVSPRMPTSARKSCSYDSLTSTPARPRPALANHRGPFNPFGPFHKSSLAHETSLVSTPTSTDSGASSPEHAGSQRTASVPEGLSVIDSQPAYMTPQNFKNIKPLQTAFMSTGLVSKRARAPPNGADGDLAPLPPRPNFANAAAGPTSGGMAAAMGLREVVAATSARASHVGNTAQATVPDTPMKKPLAGSLAQHMMGGAVGSASRQPPPSVLRPTAASRPPIASSLSSSISPAKDAGSGTDGESPLLDAGACDSPTMNLVSVSNSNSALSNGKAPDDWPQFSTLPREHSSPKPSPGGFAAPNDLTLPQVKVEGIPPVGVPSEDDMHSTAASEVPLKGRQPMRRTRTNAPPRAAPSVNGNRKLSRPPASRSISEQAAGTRYRSRLSDSQNSETSESEATGPSSRPAFMRHRSRPSSGLQRKASFGVGAAEQQNGVASPTLGFFPIPSTPTRHSGQIKWFEAARLVTTPSPPSRRQSKTSMRYAQGGSKSKSLRGETVLPLAAAATSQVGRFESQFVQLSILGSGEFSEAIKAEDRATGSIYAVKRMKRRFTGPKDRLRHLEEVDILRLLGSHPNVISLADAWEEDNHLFIQTELCPLGTLSFFLEGYGYLVGHLDEPRLWKVLTELASGIQHIHSHGVLHLDLKPANVFVTSVGSLKIGDFGLASRWPPAKQAQILAGARVDTVAGGLGEVDEDPFTSSSKDPKSCNLEREGDREYLAPEVMLDGEYSEAVDIFALGLIMVEAVGNVILPDNGEPWQKLRNDDLSDVDFSNISISLFRLIQRMLLSAPLQRPTVQNILDHPVVLAVQDKMRQGLRASELDQLPDFELPQKAQMGDLSTINSVDSLSPAQGNGSSAAVPPSSSVTSASDKSDRSDQVTASALGLTGVGDDAPAVPIRGALIQEGEHFLAEVLRHDPDPEAREMVPCQEHDGSVGDASFTGLGLEAWTEEGESNMGDESYILGNHFADETLDENGWHLAGDHEGRPSDDDGMDIDCEDN